MRTIHTDKMPVVKGHYSPVVEHGGVVYVSGQIPTDPSTGSIPEGIEAQTRLVFSKLELLLNEAGSSLNNVLQVRIYISDIEMWNKVNEVYSTIFNEHKPARCIVPSGRLHHGALIEAEAVACLK
jgi:2-iminobutanoate/2-iminopropanoate deaminase